MNRRKLTAAITALTCCVGMAAYMPQLAEKNSGMAAELVSNDFEVTYEGWHGSTEFADVTAKYGIGTSNSRGMLVSGRQDSTDGASSSKGFYLAGGFEYTYSVWVRSDSDETFRLGLRCLDEETDKETKVELVSKNAKAGEWTELTAKYTAPENSYEFELTITTDSTNDFVFDDVKVTGDKDGTEVWAAGNGLKEAFKGYGFRVGNILNGGTIRNSAITANILKDCDAVECENETKPDATLSANGSTNTNVNVSLNSCAAIADFCEKNNLGFRGHTFVWHSQTPEWFFKEGFNSGGGYVNSSTMDQRMESYIKNMFAAFGSQYPTLNVYSYDVCNECVSDDSGRTANNGGARMPGYGNGASPWVQVYGDNSFIEKAFTYARKYAPEGCKLYYNDYNEYWDHKRDCIINTILKPLSAKGVLDGMGMQSHIDAGYDTFSGTVNYLRAMDMYLDLGIDVQVTELDISVDSGKFTDQQQADKYAAIAKHIMEANTSGKYKGRVTLFQIWGPNDANSWLSSGSNALLYDSNNNPKSAYTSLMTLGDGNGPLGSIDTPPAPLEPDADGYWFHHTFENGTESWSGRGAASADVSSSSAYKGSKSLAVTGRTDEWNGSIFSLNRAFEAGTEYSFSVNVAYDGKDDTRDFKLTLEYTNADGDTTWDEIASGTTSAGQWVQLANTNYKLPSEGSGFKIIVETTDGTLGDFYIDEAIGAPAGTKIEGAGQPAIRKAEAGDVDGDGVISSLDTAMARRVAAGKITDSICVKAADVDKNGKVDNDDVKQINDFVMGRISEFEIYVPEVQPMRTISEYTPVVANNVSISEPNDSHNEKAGVQYGTIVKKSYYSSFCKREKPYNVLLPAGYTESKKYPVLYVMHGYYENQDRMIIEGNGTMYTRQIIGNAIAEGAAKDMIVVFPYIFSSQTLADCTGMNDENNLAYDNFDTVLTTELMPEIAKNFSILEGRENTAITGFSMGGRESLMIGMKHPDLFGYVGAICPAPGATGAWKFASEEAAPSLIFITAGGNDTVVYSTPNGYHENFTNNNVPHVWHYYEQGYHGDNSIHAHLYNFVRAVFQA